MVVVIVSARSHEIVLEHKNVKLVVAIQVGTVKGGSRMTNLTNFEGCAHHMRRCKLLMHF